LERLQEATRIINAGELYISPGPLKLFTQQGHHWYFIIAWLCKLSGVSVEHAYPSIMMATSFIFLISLYSFGLYIFRHFRLTRSVKGWIAAASVLFFVMHTGVLVFSYFRYYPLAPAMLNLVVCLTATAIWLNFLESTRHSIRGLVFLPFLVLTLLTVHSIEGSFFFVLAVLSSLAAAFRDLFHSTGIKNYLTRRSFLLAALTSLSFVAIFLYFRHTSVPIGEYRSLIPTPLLKRGFIADPSVSLTVITIWGLFVYLIFVSRIRIFYKSAFLFGGMLIPLATYFNPFFVDLVLRVYPNGAAYVYRYGYIVPLYFIAGWAFVHAIIGLTSKTQKLPAKFLNALVLIALLELLFPVYPSMENQSRLLSLKKTPTNCSHYIWSDLFNYLETLPPQNVVSDPVTAYLIGGLTHHHVNTDKFYALRWRLEVDSDTTPLPSVFRRLDTRNETLLVVNRRPGAELSEAGAISIHWDPDIMQVARYYSELELAYIAERPETFELIWERDNISVYRLHF
ncbi:MAG: hypothetical protein GX811_03720, partial [Lentisphaerae bacterium]|nr:hypothetical protein [Lentisphaerota bacterium]